MDGADLNPSLKCRQFVSVDEVCRSMSISVMTYNILAESAVPLNEGEAGNFGGYEFCPVEYRRISNRHPRMMREIETLRPDIVCMQEVESDHYEESLKPDMNNLGYSSVAHLRFDHLGLAIFYKNSKLKLVNEQELIVHKKIQPLLKCNDIDETTSNAVEQFMDDNSRYPECPNMQPIGCLMAEFSTHSGQIFCVTNLHVSYKELRFPVLQILQAAAVIEESYHFSNNQPTIFAGDFNSEPDTPLYNFIQTGRISQNSVNTLLNNNYYLDPHLEINGQKAVDIIEKFSNKLTFSSSYREVQEREPSHTNTDEAIPPNEGESGLYQCCLDYIWFSEGFKPVSVLAEPDPEITRRYIGLPNEIFPSDHLPLLADLKFCGNTVSNNSESFNESVNLLD